MVYFTNVSVDAPTDGFPAPNDTVVSPPESFDRPRRKPESARGTSPPTLVDLSPVGGKGPRPHENSTSTSNLKFFTLNDVCEFALAPNEPTKPKSRSPPIGPGVDSPTPAFACHVPSDTLSSAVWWFPVGARGGAVCVSRWFSR